MRGKTAPTPPGECFEDRDVECTPNAPRNYDGTCVNPENPLYGSTNTAQTRMAGNSYEDSMSRPREFSVVSRIQNRAMRLPSSRQVSTAMSKNRDVESNKVTYLFNQMAQFVAHDLVLSKWQLIFLLNIRIVLVLANRWYSRVTVVTIVVVFITVIVVLIILSSFEVILTIFNTGPVERVKDPKDPCKYNTRNRTPLKFRTFVTLQKICVFSQVCSPKVL